MARFPEVTHPNPAYVLDASVVLKWFLRDKEGEVEQALRLRDDFLAGFVRLLAPELLVVETANVMRFKKGSDSATVTRAVASLWQMEFILPGSSEVSDLATRLAFELGATIYDTTYLALAEVTGARLVTADKKFYKKADGRGSALLLTDMDKSGNGESGKR